MINMITQIFLIERSVQFEEEPMPTTEIGESSSPPSPLTVSEDADNFYDSYMSRNYDLIAYTNTPSRQKWETNTIHVAGELDGNPSDPKTVRSQFVVSLYVKDPFFVENLYLMIESYPKTHKEASDDPICKKNMNEEYHSLEKNETWELVNLALGRKIMK